MWKFEKRAGLILDQQDDPGCGWEKIAEFWPEDMDQPLIGIKQDEESCIADLTDGHTKIAKYPTKTPEDTLASSMYFLMYGIDSIEKKAHKHIAQGLQNCRVAWDVKIPEGFIDFVKEAGAMEKQAEHREEIFVDDDGHLPVTTPQQCRQSIDMFEKNANKWSAGDRMVLASGLQEASDLHGLDMNVRYAGKEMSKNASGAINARRRVMEKLHDHPGRVEYLSNLTAFKEGLSHYADYHDLVDAVSSLERMDKEAGMDEGWGDFFPDPVDSFLEGVSEDFFPALEKNAEKDYNAVNWDGLDNHFDSDIADEISGNPQAVIPTLPTAQRNIVEDYINEQIRSK